MTHFSVVDSFGNAVANTYTLNFSYGLGLVAVGRGVLLNNELDDFRRQADAPNAYGLLGYQANAPEPGKRPLSSMTPTIVLEDGKPFLVTGSPGGSLDHQRRAPGRGRRDHRGMDIAVAVSAPRVHNQWMPDLIFAEPGVAGDVIARSRRAATRSWCGACRRRPTRYWSRRSALSAPSIRARAGDSRPDIEHA